MLKKLLRARFDTHALTFENKVNHECTDADVAWRTVVIDVCKPE